MAMSGEAEADLSPTIVVGCPRSGTTLLSVMLDRHTQLAIPPETAFYDEVAPALVGPDQAPLRGVLRRWRRLGELGMAADEVIAACGPEPTRARLFAALLGLYARKHGKARFGEKTPQHLPHVPTILSDFPGARVLCLMRDGRDAALSLAAMPWWTGGLDGAVAAWLRAEIQCTAFEAAFPGRFAVVRCETLVGAPAETLRAVMDFLGLAFEPTQLDPRVASRLVLDRSRAWKGQALLPPDPGAVGRRRRGIHAGEIEALERALGPALERRGYRGTLHRPPGGC